MAFRRPRRNRRFERKHVLDVKLSARQRRKSWRRRVGISLSLLFVGLAVVLVGQRGFRAVLDHWIYQNPTFAIHHLQMETDGVFSLEQLRSWSGVRLRDNLMAVDLARVKRDLELVSAIESAAIERILPHTLHIRVIEREPIAQVIFPLLSGGSAPGRGVYTLDANGVFMFPIEPQQRARPVQPDPLLPVISGVPAADIRPGRQTELPQLQAALQWIQVFERSPMAGLVDLQQVDLSVPNVLQVTTRQHCELVFGLRDWDAQLRRWHRVHEYGRSIGKHLMWLDLSVSNNVPSRWEEARRVTPAVSPTNSPSPYRNKHV